MAEDVRRNLAELVDAGFAGESSLVPRPSRRPDKEPLTPINEVDHAEDSSPSPGGDAGERSLKQMLSNDIHQAFLACQAQGALLELTLFHRLMLAVKRSTRKEVERRAAASEGYLDEMERLLGHYQTICSRQSRTIQELEQEVDALRLAGGFLGDSSLAAARKRPDPSSRLGHGH
ncbi:uncharacterized protein A4U43_C05F30480 [Asparagus officinalis]|uniref:Uncharacterized protein n=1 Tax=Asparagus officinalis TaxID=4686 RepID=A0A5P1F067_ASPOF|nr:uncharacterized protein A4U43_C05F30480 [Asparagus officinalis]